MDQRHQPVQEVGLTVLFEPDRPSLDIVFVHGFTGSPDKTWTHKRGDIDCSEPPPKFQKLRSVFQPRSPHLESTAVFWPRDLLPKTIPDARVLTYGYDTHLRHKIVGPPLNKMTLNDIARDLLISLEASRRAEPSRRALFVCHSLGGIVVKEMLRQACYCHDAQLQSVFESTRGIVFFGTPHRGADPRQLLQHVAEKLVRIAGLSVNEDIVNTLLPTSGLLRQLNDEFNVLPQKQQWGIFSFQEAHGVKILGGKQVVEDMSSYLGLAPIERTQHINRDHMNMCRFTGAEDTEYKKVVDALRGMIASIDSGAKDCERSCETPSEDTEYKTLSEDQRGVLLDSLRFEQIDHRFKSVRAAHAKTCCWFLETPEYLDWLDAQRSNDHHGFLWIKGKPGAGKSTLMKFVIDRFHRFQANPRNEIVFFFNARGAELEKTTIGMYRSLLVQLLKPRPKLHSAFDAAGFMAWNATDKIVWCIESLKRVFEEAVFRLDRSDSVTCFIDALDECSEKEIRDMVEFFEQLADSAVAKQIRFKIMFSSRHYPHIAISQSLSLVLEGQKEHSRDIQRYVETKLKIKKRDDNSRQRILDRIQEKASGVFMWVVLVVDILNKSNDEGRPASYLEKKLGDLPDNLHELFRDILTRDGNCKDELLLCLQWVAFARRPLTSEELYYAIHATTEQIQRFILNSSKGLTEITTTKSVQFIHESVRDFLLKERGLETLWTTPPDNLERESHSKLAECCHEYINLRDTQELVQKLISQNPANDPIAPVGQKHPFLVYATENILHHANAAAAGGLLQDDFLRRFSLRGWVALHNQFEDYKADRYDSKVTLLYVLAENNLAALIPAAHFLEPGQSCLDIETHRFGTPLFAARATKSDEAALALMQLATQAQPLDPKLGEICEIFRRRMLPDGSSWHRFRFSHKKSLSSQAVAISDSIIALFIETKDYGGRTPLSWAACQGHEAVIKLLLDNGAEMETKDYNGWTPLSWAVCNEGKAVIKVLLDNGAEIEMKDNSGRTPGYVPVVQLLLEKGADVNSKDNSGRTPLWWAAEGRHETIVRLLLEKGDDVDSKDNSGQTPLSLVQLRSLRAGSFR
ncbi:hypothetical protein C8A00DRAFT_44431 [Chaetomidium leptoderma]|uniref:NACHT domain-containing protein n=1 Tax=Chaetomidium leptoderma TaxID=669021 RepID=A0AAN6VLQ5_9PEZI|nr:hypothetical protein C8A00DRAFT_44431 [Chaetomidium leptoderma]